jgi:3-methylcrotonyl-CoA carboxylase alpha subunit
VDSGVTEGSDVTLYYDSLLAKAVAFGETRAESCARLTAGLRDFVISGPATTIPFLIAAVEHPIFAEGRATTRFIEDAFAGGWAPQRTDAPYARAVAAIVFASSDTEGAQSAWRQLAGFRVLGPAGGLASSRVIVQEDQAEHTLNVEALRNDRYRVVENGERLEIDVKRLEGMLEIASKGRVVQAPFHLEGSHVSLAMGEERYAFIVSTEIEKAAGASGSSKSGAILSPMPGIVSDVKVAVGDTVDAKQVVVVIESMKLFISLESPAAGTVKEVACVPGETVQAGARLILVEPAQE